MSMIHTFAHLGLLLCILAYVAAYQDQQSKHCKPDGGYCQLHTDCCSGTCRTYNLYCIPAVDHFDPIKVNKINIYDVMKPKPIKDEVQIYSLPDESEPLDDVFAIEPKTNYAAECNQIGEPCSRAEECCNLRCHTYLHRCVT